MNIRTHGRILCGASRAAIPLFIGCAATTPVRAESYTGPVNVLNNQNYSAGTNGITIVPGNVPVLNFVRSNGTWADTWWDWKMGVDNKLRLGFCTVPQLTFQNGAVGLGTDAPLNRLHVGDGDIRISRISGTWGPNLLLDGTKVGTGGALWSITSSTASDLGGAGRLAFVVNNGAPMVLSPTGNVGIGTTNPGLALDVVGSHVGGTGIARFTGSANVGYISVDTAVSAAANSGFLAKVGGTLIGQFAADGTTNTAYIANRVFGTTPIISLPPSGNVGIGTANPTNKLEVAGTIRAKEVIVETTGWADHVLAPDYQLAPLSEVEAHIAAKGTLPGIPSAGEVVEKGVSVGDMQARLLAKVEELTLHVIEQEKRIAKLEAENAALRKHMP